MQEISLGSMWTQMGPIPKAVVFVLLFMSIYSILIDRYIKKRIGG
jgi:Na+-translocating ferredoxin:NAD+ oxidoreductase RnfD subunit